MFDTYCPGAARRPPLRLEKTCMVILVVLKWLVSVAVVLEFLNLMDMVKLLESGGGALCHHQPARCFTDSKGAWVVCARCTGMYLGWLLPATLSPILEPWVSGSHALRMAAGLFALAAVAALVERVGVFSASNTLRACLGAPLGMFPAMLVIFVTKLLKESNNTPLQP